jgi:hypothetical protein
MPALSEYIGSLCEIKSLDNQFIISRGKITEAEGNILKVADKSGNIEPVSFNTQVKVNVFNSKTGFCVLIGNILTSTENEVKITDVISLVEHERRQFFRVDLKTHTNAYVANTLVEANVAEPMDIVITDLSISGVRIETRSELKIGSTIWIEFNIKNKNYLWQCSVIRIVEYDRLDVFHYGCQFIFEDSKENDILCSYLFQKQREQLSQKSSY